MKDLSAWMCLSLLSTLAFALAAVPSEAEVLWALEFGGSDLRIIDRTTGQDVATISSTVDGSWRGIAIHPTTGGLYATETEYLYSIVKTRGTATQIGLFGSVLVRDLTFDDLGQLYGVTGNQGADANSLHTIDLMTGAATLLLSLDGNRGHGIAHDAAQPGTLYHLADGVFERVDLAGGGVTTIGLSGDPILGLPLGLEYDPIDGLFRFFDNAGRYYTVERDGTVTAVGTQNPTVYFGLGFDEAFESNLFDDDFESGTTDAWTVVVP